MRHLILLALFLATPALASKDDLLAEKIRANGAKTVGERVIVWTSPAWTDAERTALAATLDRTVIHVEKILGRRFAADGYGQAHIEYYLLDADDKPSHVHGGYSHAAGSKPYVFLAGYKTGESPYVHETAHILAGDFGSLLLREGLATYAHLASGAGRMRPLVKFGVSDFATLDAAVKTLFRNPEQRQRITSWVQNPAKHVAFTDNRDRALFYAASASLVAFLVDELGMETFMRLYTQPTPNIDPAVQRWLKRMQS